MSKLIKDFPLIFEEGPIARSYLQLFRTLEIKHKKILYLLNNKFLLKNISYKLQFRKNLYYPLKFLKDKKVIYLVSQFQEFFNFEKNFVFEMYKRDSLRELDNIFFIDSDKVNSEIFVETLRNINDDILINTSKQIYKNFTQIIVSATMPF